MRSLVNMLGRMTAEVIAFLFFFFFLSLGIGLVKDSIAVAERFHWLAGAIAGLLWIMAVAVFCIAMWYAMRSSAPRWLRDYMLIRPRTDKRAGLAEQYPAAAATAMMCVVIGVAVVATTYTSANLESHGVLAYVTDEPTQLPMTELLFRLYSWHVVDLIPVVDVWTIYNVHPPVRPANFWAQTLVLVFRAALIGFSISVLVQVVTFHRERHASNG